MLKILFIGTWAGTAGQRIRALERLGHTVTVVDPEQGYFVNKYVDYWSFRTGVLGVSFLYKNYIISKVKGGVFDVVFVEQGTILNPDALVALKKIGGILVNFNLDNPYVPRDGHRWRLFLKGLPIYDLVATHRASSAKGAYRAGARRVLLVREAADEVVHRPIALTEEDRARFSSKVVFVGCWFPERGPFLLRLIERGVPLRIFGARWRKAPEYEKLRPHLVPGNLEGDDYVKAICGASIAIGLLSKGNEDLHTTRSLEIPAIGTLFCAERTSDHLAMYEDGREAVFFDGPDECANHCLSLLADPARIEKIAAAGFKRVRRNGDFNEKLLAKILDAALNTSQSRIASVQEPASLP